MLQRYEKAEAMASEKPKDLGCADVGSKYRVSNIATTEAQCRQTSVQCTPQRGKSSQPGTSERSERHPRLRANPSDTPQRKPNAAKPAFNVRPNGAKAPSPGQASAASDTSGCARTRPIRPNGSPMSPNLRSMYAPTGQKLPARGKRAQRATPRVAREPVRYAPTGQKQQQERSNPAHENIRHIAPHPAPRPTPIINLARTRVYIRKTNPSKNVSTLQPSFKTR